MDPCGLFAKAGASGRHRSLCEDGPRRMPKRGARVMVVACAEGCLLFPAGRGDREVSGRKSEGGTKGEDLSEDQNDEGALSLKHDGGTRASQLQNSY